MTIPRGNITIKKDPPQRSCKTCAEYSESGANKICGVCFYNNKWKEKDHMTESDKMIEFEKEVSIAFLTWVNESPYVADCEGLWFNVNDSHSADCEHITTEQLYAIWKGMPPHPVTDCNGLKTETIICPNCGHIEEYSTYQPVTDCHGLPKKATPSEAYAYFVKNEETSVSQAMANFANHIIEKSVTGHNQLPKITKEQSLWVISYLHKRGILDNRYYSTKPTAIELLTLASQAAKEINENDNYK